MDIELCHQVRTSGRQFDIYKLESTKDYIVVNDVYNGIIVYNIRLERVASFNLNGAEVVIRDIFTDRAHNQIVLTLESGIWYINLDSKQTQFFQIDFEYSPHYILFVELRGNLIYLFTGSNVLEWNIQSNSLSISPMTDVKDKSLLSLATKRKAILKNAYIGLDYVDGTWVSCDKNFYIIKDNEIISPRPIEESKWYKFDVLGDYFLAIDEYVVNIGRISNQENRLPIDMVKCTACHGGRLFFDGKFTYLIILLTNEWYHRTHIRSYKLID